MSELATPPAAKERVVRALIDDALKELDDRYGSDSRSPLAYHNRTHTEGVLTAARWMAEEAVKARLLTEDDLPTMDISAVNHDIIQGLGHGADESESAHLAQRAMVSSGVFT